MPLTSPPATRRGYGSLTILWLAVHLLPFIWLTDGRNYTAETVQARTLLDYGFWERKGASMMAMMSAGILPNPADFNYVNHPYPIVWLYTFLYWLFGAAGAFALGALMVLVGCLLTYRFLKYFFSPQIAWITTAVLIAAHATVEFATNTDVVAQSAIVWPLAGVAIVELRNPDGRLRKAAPWFLGLAVFAVGQISWFALTAVPVLLLLCIPPAISWRDALRRPASVPGWPAILLGAAATLAVFIGQIAAYSPDLRANVRYLQTQGGAGGGFLAYRLRLAPVLLLRALLAGPALWLGAAAGVVLLLKPAPAPDTAHREHRHLAAAMLIYLLIFGLVTLAIPRLLYLNQHAFRFNVWPCAILTAFVLTRLDSKWFQNTLIAVAVPSLLFCYAKIHDYRASEASVALGHWLAANTKPTEIIFSNFHHLKPPIQPWDGECFANANAVADRFMVPRVSSSASLLEAAKVFKGQITNAVFLAESSQPIEPAFESSITSSAQGVLVTNVPVPPQGLVVFKSARASLWQLLGKLAPESLSPGRSGVPWTNSFHLKLYHLSPEFIRKLDDETRPAPAHAESPINHTRLAARCIHSYVSYP